MPATPWNHGLCLETANWNESFDDMTSVRPLLEVLSTTAKDFRFVHRTVATMSELSWHLEQWLQSGSGEEAYYTLYIASHGSLAGLALPDGSTVGLDVLGRLMEGELDGCVVHLGACSMLHGADDQGARAFLERTGASAVMGYSTDVDWNLSAAFDLLLLNRLSRFKSLKHVAESPELVALSKLLGFHMVRR